MRRFHIPLLVLLFFLPLRLLAAEDRNSKEILVITTHAEASEWAQDMMLPIDQLGEARKDIHVESYYLRLTSLSSVDDLKAKEAAIFADYRSAPDLVILVGASSYALSEDVDKRWPGVPMLLAGEHDYYCDMSYAIGGKADPDIDRPLVFALREKGLNITLLHTPAFMPQTVNMMFTVQPQIKKLIFIAGENYQSREQQLRLEKYLGNKYPDIEYKPVYSTDYTTDGLIDLLKSERYPETGVLFGSWFSHEDYRETISSRHNVTHIIESIAPVFTMLKCDLELAPGIIGYFSYDHESYCSIMQQRIESILDDGFDPRDLSFVHFEVGPMR